MRLPLVAFALLGTYAVNAASAEDFVFYHENVLGTSLELKVAADSRETAQKVEAQVLAEVDRLNLVFSGYDPTSEFSRWQAAPRGPIAVSPELFEVLEAAERWRTASAGAFDIRIEALSRLWSQAAKRGKAPTAEELAEARRSLQRPALRLDQTKRTAERLTDAPLSLNAIAKGYIVEKACAAGTKGVTGVRGVLLNIGGDLRVVGERPRTIGVARPAEGSDSAPPICGIEVRDRAIASSGPYHRGFQVGGRWYSHIIDPRSGLPTDHVAGATVIAERSADADALATILNVLPSDEGLKLVEKVPGVACLIVTSGGRMLRSSRWPGYERPRAAIMAGPVEPSGLWGDDHELLIKFEINQPDSGGGRYRKPYIAVWVENAEGFPVRNLAVWVSLGGSGPWQWLPDLKRWYRAEDARRKADRGDMVDAIGQATRPPGKYSLTWDGRDDKGKPLPAGEYTVSIEAAREHGTYQIIRKALKVGGDEPLSEDLKGGVEIKGAQLEYRRKTEAP
jgi:thiamine biosynthesis lipoprotein ApbE